MPESILDIVTRLLRYQRAPLKLTAEFKNWKHDNDILPGIQQQLESILTSYGTFGSIVYDTQGIHDDGTDLVLRSETNGAIELICFQAKSYDDLCKDTYMQQLKAQRDDTFRKVIGLHRYFLALCTDPSSHKARIRNISAEFRSAERTEVIEPEFMYTFFKHPRNRIDAWVKFAWEADDTVLKRAIEAIQFANASARALAIFIAVESAAIGITSMNRNELISSPILQRVYDEIRERQQEMLEEAEAEDEDDWEEWEDEEEYEDAYDGTAPIAEFEEQLAEDLDLLDTDLVSIDAKSEIIDLRHEQLLPLVAVVADALVRHEYTKENVLPYMFSLFRVLD